MKRPALRKTSKKWLTNLFAGLGGLMAAAISLGYSLYEQRESEVIPQVEVSTPVDAGRWKVAVEAASIVAVRPDGGHVSPAMKAIAIDLILENVSAESSNLYGSLITLINVTDASKPQYYLKRDRAILWDLQPRMREAVTAVWEVPASRALPNSLELRVEGDYFKPRDNLYAAPGWFSSGSVAKVTLPFSIAAQRAVQ